MPRITFRVMEVTTRTALRMVQKYHYSNTLPKINKRCIGFFVDDSDEPVGIVTLGLGTRPLHTIRRLFPSLGTSDYYEIGRMCMTDEMPRNSESQMLSALVKWIRVNDPQIKVLFTWADGMLGRPGYVYQAANFIYAGYSPSDTYFVNGARTHPRGMKKLLAPDDPRVGVRPTLEQMNSYGIQHYRGRQFRYVLFTCSRSKRKELMRECTVDLSMPNPKKSDCVWQRRNRSGTWVDCSMPSYNTDVPGPALAFDDGRLF